MKIKTNNKFQVSELKTSWVIFFTYFSIRLLFTLFSGYDNCELCSDSATYLTLSERILAGNFDLDVGRFIVSPLYPFLISVFKICFGSFSISAIVLFQLTLSAVSGVYLYKLAKNLFNYQVALLATVIFAVYPFTFWWVHSICTEIVFQSFLIIALFYIHQMTIVKDWTTVLIAALLFSLTFLTKSHILLFAPIIFLSLMVAWPIKIGISKSLVFAGVCFLTTLPFGFFNLNKHQQYVISSNGGQFHFYTGNSPFGYQVVFGEKEKLQEINHLNYMATANGSIHDSLMALPHKLKQPAYFNYALNWIATNTLDFIKLKLANAFNFLSPGFNFRYYPFKLWLVSFLLSAPIFLFAYITLWNALTKYPKEHLIFIGLFAVMFGFSVLWYNQNRFRTITLEPILIIYAASAICSKFPLVNRLLNKVLTEKKS
ncbi:MAG: glycosyltransferase family 39 protein [Flavobacteriales bacterium]|nr:glycosyltransferase family 39 protein [Flavobacteriales bacterium]